MTTDTPLMTQARQWVIDNYPYNAIHLLKALEWLDRIAPDASEAMRLATLTHDMERAFPGPDQPIQKRIDGLDEDAEYNRLHSARSARLVGEWLHEVDADAVLRAEVERLINAHESGGWPEATLVQAADSLSFLETNIDLFMGFARDGKRTLDEVAIKFFTTYERIQVPEAKKLAQPLYSAAIEQLSQTIWRPLDAHYTDIYLTILVVSKHPEKNMPNLIGNLKLNVASIKTTAAFVENVFNIDTNPSGDRSLFPDKDVFGYMRIIAAQADEMTKFLDAASQYDALCRRYRSQQKGLLQ